MITKLLGTILLGSCSNGVLTAGNRLVLSITLGELFSEDGPVGEFKVENWTETTETIDFPAG